MSTVARYALVRIASACLTLFGVAVLIFGAIHALPGSFEEVLRKVTLRCLAVRSCLGHEIVLTLGQAYGEILGALGLLVGSGIDVAVHADLMGDERVDRT